MLAIAPAATRAILVMLNPASSTNHPPILRHPPHYPPTPVHAPATPTGGHRTSVAWSRPAPPTATGDHRVCTGAPKGWARRALLAPAKPRATGDYRVRIGGSGGRPPG